MPVMSAFPPDDYPQCLTVVIHERRHEPVYTATEVRAKDQDLTWAMTWMKKEAAHWREMGNPQPALEMAVDMVIKRHGLSIESDADVTGMTVPKSDHHDPEGTNP